MPNKIKSVRIKGFKSHLNSEFNYAPGLSVVTGPTDSGKSAGVMQPIKWVAFGEPSGEAFIFTVRDPKTKEIVSQAEAVEVEIQLDNGLEITKTRRKGKTAYYINGRLISEKAEVPEEVKEALGLSKQSYGDFETSLNFAYQLDAPFILSETASVGAKVLGKLAGTEIVDKAIAAIMKRTYKAREERSIAQKIIDQVNVELIEYLQVDDILEKVQACESLLTILDQDTAQAEVLRQLVAGFSVLSDKIGTTEIKLARLHGVQFLPALLTAVENDLAAYNLIYQTKLRYNQLTEGLDFTETALALLKDVGKAAVLLNQVEADNTRHSAISLDYNQLPFIAGRLNTIEAYLERFTGLPTASSLVQVVESDNTSQNAIRSLYEALVELETRMACQEQILIDCQYLRDARSFLDTLERDKGTAEWLDTQITVIEVTGGKIKQLQARINAFNVLPDCNAALGGIEAQYWKLETLRQLIEDYTIRQMAVDQAKRKADACKTAVSQAEKELAEAWADSGDVCPLCERPMKDSHIHVREVAT